MVEEKCTKCQRPRIDDTENNLCIWCSTALHMEQNKLLEPFKYNDCGVITNYKTADKQEIGNARFEIKYAQLYNGKYVYDISVDALLEGFGSSPSCFNKERYSSLEEVKEKAYKEIKIWIEERYKEKCVRMLNWLNDKIGYKEGQPTLF